VANDLHGDERVEAAPPPIASGAWARLRYGPGSGNHRPDLEPNRFRKRNWVGCRRERSPGCAPAAVWGGFRDGFTSDRLLTRPKAVIASGIHDLSARLQAQRRSAQTSIAGPSDVNQGQFLTVTRTYHFVAWRIACPLLIANTLLNQLLSKWLPGVRRLLTTARGRETPPPAESANCQLPKPNVADRRSIVREVAICSAEASAYC
jgi:hypothetical protein